MIALVAFIISLAVAAPVPRPATKSNPAILAARQKMVEKNRRVATQLIVEALANEKNEDRAVELKKELHGLATVFISNEGQRLFELAESVRFSGQPGYMPKYEEALKYEDSNWQILISQGLGLLRDKECAKAVVVLDNAEGINPGREETEVLKAYARLCIDAALVTTASLESLSLKQFEIPKKILLAKKAAHQENWEQALSVSREIIAMDKDYPTGYYLAWQAIKREENAGLDEAQSYLGHCRGLTSTQRRKYFLDPELCLETANVEQYIKQLESQAQ